MTRTLAVLLCLLSTHTLAAPPPEGSEDYKIMHPYAQWVTSQHDRLGRWCCSIADGRPVDAKISPEGHWQVMFQRPETISDDAAQPVPSGWINVPDDAVIKGANPMGVPIAWWYRGRIQCFCPIGGV